MSESIDEYLAGVAAVRESVKGMTPSQLLARPIEGRWSTLEVVCHLVDSEIAWTHRMKRTLAETLPLLIGYDETHFAARLGYHDQDLDEQLELFDRVRSQMAKVLRRVAADDWTRQAVHNERGLISLSEMVRIEIDHVNHHLKHIEAKRRALGL